MIFKKLENEEFFNDDVYKSVYPTGSRPARMYACMVKLMRLQWARLWYPFSPIFSWDIMKRSKLGITIMEGCFIIKGMSMIYLQFLKLKIMLLHFVIISIGKTGI